MTQTAAQPQTQPTDQTPETPEPFTDAERVRWIKRGERLRADRIKLDAKVDAWKYAAGDWWNEGGTQVRTPGLSRQMGADLLGIDYDLLAQYAFACRAVPTSLRSNLPMGKARILAGVPAEHMTRYVEDVAPGLSERDLRARIADEFPKQPKTGKAKTTRQSAGGKGAGNQPEPEPEPEPVDIPERTYGLSAEKAARTLSEDPLSSAGFTDAVMWPDMQIVKAFVDQQDDPGELERELAEARELADYVQSRLDMVLAT